MFRRKEKWLNWNWKSKLIKTISKKYNYAAKHGKGIIQVCIYRAKTRPQMNQKREKRVKAKGDEKCLKIEC